jgi:hypothetical protein
MSHGVLLPNGIYEWKMRGELIEDTLPKHSPTSISSDYIYRIIHKNQKGKPLKKDLPLLKNDITTIVRPQKIVIYSRYQKLRGDDFFFKQADFN